MRKRIVNHIADTWFWYLLYFLPVLAFMLYLFSVNGSVDLMSFGSFLDTLGFGFIADNTIVSLFSSVFGQGGILPIFSNNDVFIMFGWYVAVYLCHLCVDLVLCLPRIGHKFLDKFTKE